MATAQIAFQVLPKVPQDVDMIAVIDMAIAVVKESGVVYEVGPMETTMEGDLLELVDIVQKSIKACLKSGAHSVFTNVKILYNPTGVLSIHEKVSKHR